MRSPSSWAVRWMSSQVRASALRGQICVRTWESKISAPPPGMLPSPAAISSSRIDRTGRFVIWAKWSISTAVQAFRCRRGKAACRSRVMPRYQSNVLVRMHAADDVQLGAAGLGRLPAAGENLAALIA